MSTNTTTKKSIAIIGGGPSAMLLASFLDMAKYEVTIYEKNKALGRKFLVAGKGGFNLSHSESMDKFKERYKPNSFLDVALDAFTNDNLRVWLEKIGVKTIIGSSKRIYPEKETKPIEVLNAILNHLESRGVKIETEKEWKGWTESGVLFFCDEEIVEVDITVFCLGGGSWKITGSDGSWLDTFNKQGIKTLPFQPVNCAYEIKWNEGFIEKFNGEPLKNIEISCQDKTAIGEAVITKFGLEGNAVYGLSNEVQAELEETGKAEITIDLKPMIGNGAVLERLMSSPKNMTDILRSKVKLDKTKIQLLKSVLSKEDFLDLRKLADAIKYLPLTITAAAEVDEAISTTGGIAISELDENYKLHSMQDTYAIGEMIDWNAPTGGYLLQACFSMGHNLAVYLNNASRV